MIQDIYPHRFDNAYKNLKIKFGDRVIIFIDNDVVLIQKSETDFSFPVYEDMECNVSKESFRYLFSVDNENYFLYISEKNINIPDGASVIDMLGVRKMKYGYFKKTYFLICTAWHLNTWYRETRYCGGCGKALIHDRTERAMCCLECGKKIYPRISPAVIIGVTDGDRIIMSKYAGRSYKGYALLSGFTEIGETLEQTVEREVMEEVGVKVKNIRYYKSQPGGIDGNILSGFFCELDGDDTLTIDENELAMAQWFKRDEIPVDDDGFSLTFEMIGFFKNGRKL